LRIHFTNEDLARTYVAPSADPLWECLNSARRLREQNRGVQYTLWIRQLLGDASRVVRARPGAAALAALAPLAPYFPDFLTPPEAILGLDAGLDAMLCTSRRQLRLQMQRLALHSRVPSWARPLAEGDVGFLARLGTSLRSYHESVVEPGGGPIQRAVDADRALRARAFVDNGIEGVFAGIGRWQSPVLEVDFGVDHDLHLEGRGLRLVPSYFCRGTADSLADPDMRPVLIYPIARESFWADTSPRTEHALDALIGTTRATVLRAIGDGGTTTELARRAKTSPASISRHTAVLREAGLITTRRDGTAVVHTLSRLGCDLLD
jgi:DNA-binding transcriptional ArsR family regulator